MEEAGKSRGAAREDGRRGGGGGLGEGGWRQEGERGADVKASRGERVTAREP